MIRIFKYLGYLLHVYNLSGTRILDKTFESPGYLTGSTSIDTRILLHINTVFLNHLIVV